MPLLQAQNKPALKPGDMAPALRFETFGEPRRLVDLGQLKGNVVVVEFWATWCGSCVAAIPHWNEMVDRFAGKRVAFISISDDEADRLAGFLKTKPIKGLVGRDDNGAMFKGFGAIGRPHTMVIAPDGKVVGITLPENITEQVLNDILAGQPVHLPEKELKGDNLDWDQEEIDWKDGVKPELYVIIKPIRIFTAGLKYKPGGNRLTADGVLPQVLVFAAYGTDTFHLDWRMPEPAGTYRVAAAVPPGEEATLMPLLRAAISAQFGITARWEDRARDVYVLKPAAGAKALTPSTSQNATFYSMRGNCHAERQAITVLVKELTNRLGKIVIDETGLAGEYDWDLPYQPGQDEVMTWAVREKLGLEVIPARRSVKILVVEKAESAAASS